MVVETKKSVEEIASTSNGEIASNGETASIPAWLDADYFKDILNREFGQHEVIKFAAKSALPKGENYASLMNRVTIDLKLEDGTRKTVSYIVKSMLESAMSASFLSDMALFPKEMEMYEKVLPQFNKLAKDSGLDIEVGAKCVKCQKDPMVIVLKDLKVDGYENINRLEGLDMKHMQVTLERLAVFHAASARIYELYGPYSEHFNKGMFAPEMLAMMEKLLDDHWAIFEECVGKWGNCEKYIPRLKDTTYRFGELMESAEKINPDDFNVLNHGDMWCNNIMFKHNKNGEIEDLKFVDLQMCKWGSPALDLQYLIVSSCNYDIRIEKFDFFIKYYHDNLIRNLKLFKYSGKVPKLVELHVQILKRGYFGLNVVFGTLSAVLLDPNDKAEMELFFENSKDANDFKRLMYSTPRYVKAAKSLIEFYDNRGVLDL